jgi:glycine/D-amino acid oxidase-like deaminating enzyme
VHDDDTLDPAAPSLDASIARRDFLRIAGAGAGVLAATGCAPMIPSATVPGVVPTRRRSDEGAGHVVVIGAGAWGGWTAWHLRRRGARVTLIDQYGPANSRATSGDETRGIRSSYGDRTTGDFWCRWARIAITRWREFDAEWAAAFHTKFFFETGDVIMRATEEPFVKRTRDTWTAQGVRHEVLTGDEARKRWPMINADDITIAITEPDAGVVRCRYATQAVAALAQQMGAKLVIGRARPGPIVNGRMDGVVLDDGTVIRGDAYVFACGVWLPKLFPRLMGNRMRIPIGTAFYFGTPEGDTRFTFPNIPSYNFPGVTGWAALPVDNRGFRVRGGIAAAPPATAGGAPAPRPAAPPADPRQEDPDTSSRWAGPERVEASRRFLARRFPALAGAPLLESRSCHYEISVNSNFIIDTLPGVSNAWIAGVGQAEGFKFGPVAGEYVAQRVLGTIGDPKIAAAFKMPTEEYEAAPPPGELEDSL